MFVIILGLAWGLLYHDSHLNPHKVTSTREFISRYRYRLPRFWHSWSSYT